MLRLLSRPGSSGVTGGGELHGPSGMLDRGLDVGLVAGAGVPVGEVEADVVQRVGGDPCGFGFMVGGECLVDESGRKVGRRSASLLV